MLSWSKIIVIKLIFLLLVDSNKAIKSRSIDYNNPVGTADQDLIKDLPGIDFELDFKQYSGYLNADVDEKTKGNKFLHYWLVESRSNPGKDPLVLWLNGGPGCSSLMGLLTELGPIQLTTDGKLVNNKFGWNNNANVLFLESPAGVGFSYNHKKYLRDDDTTAAENYMAIRNFYSKFPDYRARDLYIAGESYAGVYLPTLGVLLNDDEEIHLKGVAIGNGLLDGLKNAESKIFFSYNHGLCDESTWEGMAKDCCGGNRPARGLCQFGTYNPLTEKCANHVVQALSAFNKGVNPYKIFAECDKGDDSNVRTKGESREHLDRQLWLSFFNSTWGGYLSQEAMKKLMYIDEQFLPCIDQSYADRYMNRRDVRRALNIPERFDRDYHACAYLDSYTKIYPQREGGLAPFVKSLLDSKNQLDIVIYNGDTDGVCNFLGDEWFVHDLGRDHTEEYAIWKTRSDGQVGGFIKKFDGITFMTFKGAGHLVPSDKPGAALEMFGDFISGKLVTHLHPKIHFTNR